MKKMFMRKVMAKFFGDANGMLSIYVFPVLLERSCSGRFLLKMGWVDLCNYFEFNLD